MNTRSFAVMLTAAVMGCASQNQKAAEDPDPRAPISAAIVVRGKDLSGNLLDGLRYRVPQMQVSNIPGECPRIMFRGMRSIRNQRDPTVYLDGTRMVDTCILNQLSANDIDFVEVYPSGNTPRSSYERNPFGLILIFRPHQ